jgi:hypothetical protein
LWKVAVGGRLRGHDEALGYANSKRQRPDTGAKRGRPNMRKSMVLAPMVALTLVAMTTRSEAKSCSELRSLCWTMRSDKSDCTGPYQRCLKTGTFITPLGRVFKATR